MVMGSSEKFKRSSVASKTGLPGKGGGLGGPVDRDRVVKRVNYKGCCTPDIHVLAIPTKSLEKEDKRIGEKWDGDLLVHRILLRKGLITCTYFSNMPLTSVYF
jgi:hypothetical protein